MNVAAATKTHEKVLSRRGWRGLRLTDGNGARSGLAGCEPIDKARNRLKA